MCKGRDSVPDNESVNLFVFEVIFYLGAILHNWMHVFFWEVYLAYYILQQSLAA